MSAFFFFFRQQCAFLRVEARKPAGGGIISVRALKEFTNVAGGNLRHYGGGVNEKLGAIRILCEVTPITLATHERALSIAERYGLPHLRCAAPGRRIRERL